MSGMISAGLFITLLTFICVEQLSGALETHGILVPKWLRLSLVAMIVLAFLLVPFEAAGYATPFK